MAEAKSAPRRAGGPDRILDAALALAAERPWRDVTLADIARTAGTDLAGLYAAFPGRRAIVAGLAARIDRKVLAGTEDEAAGEPVREQLIDLLMRRLDALADHKGAVASLLRDALSDPRAAVCAAPALLRSMAWTLEAAGVSAAGLGGAARTHALAAIWLSTLRCWLRDDSADLGPTLAHLDRALRRAERLESRLPRRPRRRAAA